MPFQRAIIQLPLIVHSFSKLAFPASLATNTLLADNFVGKRQQAITDSQAGQTGGFYWSFWSDIPGNAQITNGAGGECSVTWSGDSSHFVAGKGLQPGSEEPLTYDAQFEVNGNDYLSPTAGSPSARAFTVD